MIMIDMDMPECCCECPCFDGEFAVCQSHGEAELFRNVRPESCPLVEIEKYSDGLYKEVEHDNS